MRRIDGRPFDATWNRRPSGIRSPAPSAGGVRLASSPISRQTSA